MAHWLKLSKLYCDACGHRSGEPDRHWTIRLEHALRSLNDIRGNVKGRYGRLYRNEKRFYLSALARKHVPKAEQWRQIIVRRLWGKRRRAFDHDNLVGGGKPLVDALKQHGIITEDNGKNCNISYFQEVSPDGKDYVEITVQEFDDAE